MQKIRENNWNHYGHWMKKLLQPGLRKNYVIGLNLLQFDGIIISKSERHLKGWKRTKRQ